MAKHDLSYVLSPRKPHDFARKVVGLQPHRLPSETLGQTEDLGDPAFALGVARLAGFLDMQGRPAGIETGRKLTGAPDHLFGDFVGSHTGDQALGGAPGTLDRLLPEVVNHLIIDPVRRPAQRQLA